MVEHNGWEVVVRSEFVVGIVESVVDTLTTINKFGEDAELGGLLDVVLLVVVVVVVF